MAIIGYGTTIGYSSDGSSYTTVGEVTEVNPPEETTGDAETTHLTSTNAAKEYIAGLIESGEAGFKSLFDKTREAALRTIRNARSTYYWKITFPDGTSQGSTLVFQGHIKKLGKMVPIEEKVESDIGIKCTGRVAFTAGT